MGSGEIQTRYLRLDHLPPGEHRINLEIELQPRYGESIIEQTDFCVRVAESNEQTLEPVTSSAINDAIVHALRANLVEQRRSNPQPEPLVRLNNDVFATTLSVLDPTCLLKPDDLAFELEIRDGDTVVCRGMYSWYPDHWMSGLSMGHWTRQYADMMRPNPSRPHMMELPREVIDRLTIYIRGSEKLAAINPRSRAFWCDELSVRLNELQNAR